MHANMPLTANELANRLGGTVEGDSTREVSSVATLGEATPESLSWIGHRRFIPMVNGSKAGVILLAKDGPGLPGRTLIRVTDPDLALVQVLRWLSPPVEMLKPGVDASARVHPQATVSGACIGPNVCVAAGAVVGPGTKLHPGVCVAAGTRIGRDCELWPNVVVRERVTIGDRVIIHPNTTIGSDGFGYLQRNGGHLKIPQVGTVVIEDDVEIGANCAVDRASTGVTRIGSGTKIDNLVQIAHNVNIGQGCIIVAQCGIAGSTALGDNVMLGGQVGIIDHLQIGRGARIAAKSAVFKDIAPGEAVRGIPATENGRFLRHEAGVRRLPKWLSELKKLQSRVAELETLIEQPPRDTSESNRSCDCRVDRHEQPGRA
jgi:UDP-3-O-[3-hydroxymyristoyl] glucosamine N-acyltransferase